MIAVIQRVRSAEVRVDDAVVSSVAEGLLVFACAEPEDTDADCDVLARKLVLLRCFPGATAMDRSLRDSGGACLLVSQFTLAADLRRGRRPSFSGAAAPETAQARIEHLARCIASHGVAVHTGRFGAHMQVSLCNDGPVTFVIAVRHGALV